MRCLRWLPDCKESRSNAEQGSSDAHLTQLPGTGAANSLIPVIYETNDSQNEISTVSTHPIKKKKYKWDMNEESLSLHCSALEFLAL